VPLLRLLLPRQLLLSEVLLLKSSRLTSLIMMPVLRRAASKLHTCSVLQEASLSLQHGSLMGLLLEGTVQLMQLMQQRQVQLLLTARQLLVVAASKAKTRKLMLLLSKTKTAAPESASVLRVVAAAGVQEAVRRGVYLYLQPASSLAMLRALTLCLASARTAAGVTASQDLGKHL
jgi:hypothetical protein